MASKINEILLFQRESLNSINHLCVLIGSTEFNASSVSLEDLYTVCTNTVPRSRPL